MMSKIFLMLKASTISLFFGFCILLLPINASTSLADSTPFDVSDVNGASGDKILLKIQVPRSLSRSREGKIWLRIFGVPEGIRFSKGASVSGVWFVSVRDLSQLHIIAPGGYEGRFSLDFALMRGNRSIVSIVGKKSIKVQFFTRKASVLSSASAVSEKQANEPSIIDTPKKGDLPEFEETILLERGKQLIKQGKLAMAHTVYKELADRGSAKAALALANFYKSVGNKPLARNWFKRAKQLGSKLNF